MFSALESLFSVPVLTFGGKEQCQNSEQAMDFLTKRDSGAYCWGIVKVDVIQIRQRKPAGFRVRRELSFVSDLGRRDPSGYYAV